MTVKLKFADPTPPTSLGVEDQTFTPDSDGVFTVPDAAYAVLAGRPHEVIETRPDVRPLGAPAEHGFEPKLAPASEGTVTVKLPYPATSLSLGGRSYEADADGNFTIPDSLHAEYAHLPFQVVAIAKPPAEPAAVAAPEVPAEAPARGGRK